MKRDSTLIENELNVIKTALLKKVYLTTQAVSKLFKPELTIRTAERRINEFKKYDSPFYLLGDKAKGYRLISKNVDWSLLKMLREKKNNKKVTVLHTTLYDKKMLNNIYNLNLAIEKGEYVNLIDYASVSAQKSSEYTVFPLKMIIGDTPFILAYDRKGNTVKQFNIGRMGKVEVTNEKGNINQAMLLKNENVDDFGFHVDKSKIWEVELLLTNYSMTLFIRDHNHLNDKITELKPPPQPENINGTDYYFLYVLKLKVGSIRVIGRLITGLLDHVKVYKAHDDFKVALREYINKTVINVLKINI